MFVMKKIITLLLTVFAAVSFTSKAQTTACNADFNFTINNFTVHFTPVMVGDSINTSHYWSFGDGSSVSAVTATHTYATVGSYSVKHYIVKRNPNGLVLCSDTVTKIVLIQQTTACNLQAYFTWHADSLNRNTIHFQNQSQPNAPGDSIRWNFGDGSAPINGLVGSLSTPTHLYPNAGTYNVCIRIKKNNAAGTAPCVSEICKTVIVTPPCNLAANFSWASTPANPLTLSFKNLTVPFTSTDSVKWTFGDGTTSFDANPTHTYLHPGTYTVCLRVKKNILSSPAPCVSEICKTVVITAACNVVAYFSAQPDPSHPLRIKFTNLSIPINSSDSVRWTFGDGTSVTGLQSDPNVANPTHNYLQSGAYTVCLRVKKNINTTGTTACVAEICKVVTVLSPCNIQVNFSMQRDSFNVRKVHFTNLTSVLTTNAIAKWSFGDGTYAGTWNAVHEYAHPGTYKVCLTVQTEPNCVREKCETIVIPNPAPSCKDQSKFKFEKFSNDNQKYKFIPDYISNDITYTWTFGDGTGSQDQVATHRYTHPGLYVACLTAWRGPNCASTTCKEIRVLPQINCDSINVGYTYQKDPLVPNKLYFYANANWPVLDQTWTISKLSPATTPPVILHQNNPVYVFHDTGYYRVCLKAITLGGCVKEFCKVIRIEKVASTVCELQAYPNPTSNLINVNVFLNHPGPIDTYIYNTLNVQVKEKHQQGSAGNNLVTVNINDLVPGLYTIKVKYGDKVCYARFNKL